MSDAGVYQSLWDPQPCPFLLGISAHEGDSATCLHEVSITPFYMSSNTVIQKKCLCSHSRPKWKRTWFNSRVSIMKEKRTFSERWYHMFKKRIKYNRKKGSEQKKETEKAKYLQSPLVPLATGQCGSWEPRLAREDVPWRKGADVEKEPQASRNSTGQIINHTWKLETRYGYF